jgi:hypothetical protein
MADFRAGMRRASEERIKARADRYNTAQEEKQLRKHYEHNGQFAALLQNPRVLAEVARPRAKDQPADAAPEVDYRKFHALLNSGRVMVGADGAVAVAPAGRKSVRELRRREEAGDNFDPLTMNRDLGAGEQVVNRAARGALNDGFIMGVEGGQRALTGTLKRAGAEVALNEELADLMGDTRKGVEAAFKVNPDRMSGAEGLLGDVAQGVGQMASTLPLAANSGLLAAQVAGQMFQQGYDDAVASGAGDDTAFKAGVGNMPAGALEFLADKFLVGKAGKALTKKLTVGGVAKKLLEGFAAEAPTESVQQGWQNYLAKELVGYAPDRDLGDGVLYSGLVGGLTGSTVTGAPASVNYGLGKTGDVLARVKVGKGEQATVSADGEVAKVAAKPAANGAVAADGGTASVEWQLAEQIVRDLPAAERDTALRQMGFDPAQYAAAKEGSAERRQGFDAGLKQRAEEGRAEGERVRVEREAERQRSIEEEAQRQRERAAEDEQARAAEEARRAALTDEERATEDEQSALEEAQRQAEAEARR